MLIPAAACFAGPATTQAVSAIDAERAVNYATTAKQLNDYTLAAPAAVNRVVVLGVDHGRLTLRTTIRPTPSLQRIELTDLPGLTSLNVRQLKDTGGPGALDEQPFTPDFFMFMHYEFAEPTWSVAAITVALTPMNLQLALDCQSPTQTKNVSLMQTTGAFNNSEPTVRLRVNINNKNADKAEVNLERSAPDFVTLRRKYPDDCARYIEPIFHLLHADAEVFSPDSKLVWQVFAADAPADVVMLNRVKSLIARFDADDYHDRKTAADELNTLGEPAALALFKIDRTKLSPEQSSRVDSFLAPFEPVSDAEAKKLGSDVNFLLDCLFNKDPAAVRDAVTRLSRLTGQTIAFDQTQPVEARREKIAELRRRLAPSTRPAP